ncbi:hypothetical protein [Lentzea aerocolonigenes]|uniref:hypothetical protein n=1 Tax=Lentzea aerocolonigenes TaxID=68170 RepID=UPI0004C2DCBE|nr:hypothetical protein [Lentzea aerocolonigenes]MCP2243867.1 hypothetical protein [Lentzea aerocolonigenes]
MIVFRGLSGLLGVIAELLDRAGTDRPLPLICLVGRPSAMEFGAELARRLEHTETPKVLFAKVDAEEDAGVLLKRLQQRLAEDRFGDQRMRRFRHLDLVHLLTTGQGDTMKLLADHHGRAGAPRLPGTGAATNVLPAWAQVVIALFTAWHRPLRFWLWTHGVWPFGSEPRWLMRQRFMVPGHSTSFVGFAERIARGDEESEDERRKLLVHAFLQDLRIAYGAGRFRLRRWQRTMYPLVLLENIGESGWQLLRLINDVRNESAEHDPLLVVATADELPAWLTKCRPLHQIKAALDEWNEMLPARRQSLREDARFIALRMPSGETPSDADESAWSTSIRPRPVPLLARRSFLTVAVVALVVAATLTGGMWLWPRAAGSCLPSPRAGVAVRWVVDSRGGECIGYSDSSAQLFGDDERMLAAQRAIFELNDEANRLHEGDPERPLISLIHFSEMTRREGEVGSADSVTEQLTGLLLRQAQANVRSDHNTPLLRIVVANGGFEMARAREVTDSLLAPLFESDPTLLGVIGMGRTVDPVESAVGVFGDLGIPVVATTLTGESLPTRSPMYFQLVPGNKAQAQLVHEFVRREGKQVDIHQPRDITGDGYLQSLRKELTALFGEPSFKLWDGEVADVKPVCGNDRIAFFAGRQADFDGFLNRVIADCAGKLPIILGDDSVARFVSQTDKRDNPTYDGKSILYVSLGGVVVLQNRECLSSKQKAAPLCAGLRALRDNKPEHGPAWSTLGVLLQRAGVPWIGERVGIAYDSAGVFLDAVARNRTDRKRIAPTELVPNRAAISHELLEMSYDGASGKVEFGQGRAGEQRPITILRLPDVKDVTAPPTCVLMLPTGCP